jgi:predicted metalloprotease
VALGGGGVGLLAIVAIGWFLGVDLTPLLDDVGQRRAAPTESRPLTEAEREAGDFAARVLATTEDVWGGIFPEQLGRPYAPPELVLFSDVTQSACGGASGASGPFYCPVDERAYLDTAFFAFMRDRLGAGGDFAAAYVIAHEVAHHVQNELGILAQTQELRSQAGPAEANRISVRTELMADCLSGLWAAEIDDLLDPGDLEEALEAARRIGDDYLAARAGRQPNPHDYTHGTSEQRMRWFEAGLSSGGDITACDTFSARSL